MAETCAWFKGKGKGILEKSSCMEDLLSHSSEGVPQSVIDTVFNQQLVAAAYLA
jgi:hypothetical protein